MEQVYWDNSYNPILLMNLAIIIGLFASIRFFLGMIAHVNTSRELFKKDNPAFGLSLTGVVFAVTIVLSGLIYGGPEADLAQSASRIAMFGAVAIAMMILTRIIFDKVTLPDISLRDEINKGNIAVAIVDTANVLAVAIILSAVMKWVYYDAVKSAIALVAAYAISQIILTTATITRRYLFRMRHKGRSMQAELKAGNIALAISFGGRKIGTALAFVIASNIVVYEVFDIAALLLPWAIVSCAIIVALKIISFIAERAILFGTDMSFEILEEKNIAAGALRSVIYISIALLLAEF